MMQAPCKWILRIPSGFWRRRGNAVRNSVCVHVHISVCCAVQRGSVGKGLQNWRKAMFSGKIKKALDSKQGD